MLRSAVFRSAVVLFSPPLPFGCLTFQSCLIRLPDIRRWAPVRLGLQR